MLDYTRFKALTFDCYGTLIDWETGILRALQPILKAHRVEVDEEELLSAYGIIESEIESGPYLQYREVLRECVRRLGRRYDFQPSDAECDALPESVKDWPAFADTSDALRRLKTKFKLVILSNIDDDLLAGSLPKLGVQFDDIITAQQAGSYKPSHNNFELALKRIALPKEEVLHVAQSLFHDHVPANTLGIHSVWINRRHAKQGSGATRQAQAHPDAEFPDMRSFAAAAIPGS